MTKPAPDQIALLARILENTPRLPDAACIGQHHLFDPATDGEPTAEAHRRHRLASQLCEECPVLTECRQWADDQKAYPGVLAGRVPTPTRPQGRPTTKESS